jgi:sulfur carrier protein ThiS
VPEIFYLSDMKIFLSTKNKKIERCGPRTVKQLLRELDIVPDTVLIIRNHELLLESDTLEDSDEIEIRNVVSGG